MASFRPRANRSAGRNVGRFFLATLHGATTPIGAARARVGKKLGITGLSGAMLLGGLAIGILASTLWQARAAGNIAAYSPITRQSGREMVASTINRLETEQADLKVRIAELRAQVSSIQDGDAKNRTTLLDLKTEIDSQRMAAGMVALQGNGIVATFDDSTARAVPENEDPAKYIIHEYDLRDIINTLWIAGAEGVSLNGERIVGNTSLYCVGTTVICNATRLSPPYVLRAIGDPQALEAALHGSPQMAKFNQRAQIYDLPILIEQNPNILVPPYNGSFVFRYAKVQGEE